MKKYNLPQKTCPICNFPFSWRKKWEKNFIVVRNVECQVRKKHDHKVVEGISCVSDLSKIFL